MRRIYLDNASTTFPKPPAVAEAICEYLTGCGANISRGGYRAAQSAEELVFSTREQLARLFHAPDCKCVAFTKNVTESLNVLLKGFLRPGDHVLVSAMEHNAVMRPLRQLEGQGISFSRIPCRVDGTLIVEAMEELVRENTRLVVMTHASNVCGTILPIAEVGAFCRRHGLRFFLDAAQSAGVLPIDMAQMGLDAVAFTGHKGLLGPQGIGGFILREDLAAEIEPLIAGGTGSRSHTELMPQFLPDRYEAGTANLPGIAGLHAALIFLENAGIGNIYNAESSLTSTFLSKIAPFVSENRIKLLGLPGVAGRVGVVSLQTPGLDPAEVAFWLDERFGVQTRVGLHCAPSAHKTLQTYPEGTIRFSFGYFNREEDVDEAVHALDVLTREGLHGL